MKAFILFFIILFCYLKNTLEYQFLHQYKNKFEARNKHKNSHHLKVKRLLQTLEERLKFTDQFDDSTMLTDLKPKKSSASSTIMSTGGNGENDKTTSKDEKNSETQTEPEQKKDEPSENEDEAEKRKKAEDFLWDIYLVDKAKRYEDFFTSPFILRDEGIFIKVQDELLHNRVSKDFIPVANAKKALELAYKNFVLGCKSFLKYQISDEAELDTKCKDFVKTNFPIDIKLKDPMLNDPHFFIIPPGKVRDCDKVKLKPKIIHEELYNDRLIFQIDTIRMNEYFVDQCRVKKLSFYELIIAPPSKDKQTDHNLNNEPVFKKYCNRRRVSLESQIEKVVILQNTVNEMETIYLNLKQIEIQIYEEFRLLVKSLEYYGSLFVDISLFPYEIYIEIERLMSISKKDLVTSPLNYINEKVLKNIFALTIDSLYPEEWIKLREKEKEKESANKGDGTIKKEKTQEEWSEEYWRMMIDKIWKEEGKKQSCSPMTTRKIQNLMFAQKEPNNQNGYFKLLKETRDRKRKYDIHNLKRS